MNVQAELADVLRVAERRLQRKSEMRDETFDRQHLRVLQLDALRAESGDGPDLRVEGGAALVLVVLLQETGIDLRLLQLTIDGVGAALLKHDAGDARVRVPDGEVGDGGSGRQREQILAFERLPRVVLE